MSYRTVLISTANRAKRLGVADLAIRYNPAVRSHVSRTIARFERADLAGRRALTEALTARTIAAARRVRYGRDFGDRYESWPLLAKNMLRDEPAAFMGRPFMGIPAATGGSTGTPLRLMRSPACAAAEQTFLDRMLGADGPAWGTSRVAILRGDAVKPLADMSPPFAVKTHFGRRLLLSAPHLIPENFGWFVDALNAFRPRILLLYPNQALNLVRLLDATGLKLCVEAVITSSEQLEPEARRLIQDKIGAPVLDFYGQAERVCFAVSNRPETYFFNPAYGRVELTPVDRHDAGAGRRAVAIVGTSFWNNAMPLVRYDTGDLAIVPAETSSSDLEEISLGVRPFLGIAGRTEEYLLSPDGIRVTGLSQVPREIERLLRVQFVQAHADMVEVRAQVRADFQDADRAKLLANLKAKIPSSMRYELKLVDRLETIPSGKAPVVIRRLAAA